MRLRPLAVLQTIAGVGLAIVCCFCATGIEARQVAITILHTCDLHGHILPTENYGGHTNLGGLARCATVIRQVRAKQPNTLVVDAGDTIQGAPVSYLSGGQAMVTALNLLHYDAWVWGNHEFDWGLEKLATCADRAAMPILNANVRLIGTNAPAQRIAAHLRPYILCEVDGVKVGIIGLNTPGIPNWSRPRLIAGLKFDDSLATLKTVVPELRAAGARVLVLVCHQGYREGGDDHANQVNAIARSFPELDVIIGGHTHRNFPEYKVGGKVLYCQADHHGIHLGRVDLTYDTEQGRLTCRESQTMLMNDTVALDAALLKKVAPELAAADKEMRAVIGQATAQFGVRGAPKQPTPVQELICAAIAEALKVRGVKVDVVVHGLLDREEALSAGPITVQDVWRLVPYENTLGVVQLTPVALREVLDEDAGAYTKPVFRGIWGLRWTFNPKAPAGARTAALTRADGTPVGEDERLAVAFSSYELASGGLRWPKLREVADRPDSRLVETDIQTRQAVLDYIRQRGTIAPVTNAWWHITAKTTAR